LRPWVTGISTATRDFDRRSFGRLESDARTAVRFAMPSLASLPMRHRCAIALVALALVTAHAAAQKGDAAPPPEKYICPNAAGATAVDCFLNAIEHLYTMCRQVKSIEIIEFGYGKSEEGVNGAKSEYCIDKHKVSMTRPYQAALREATGSTLAVDMLRGLHEQWLKALAELKWQPPESDAEYKTRVAKPYEAFRERAAAVRTTLASSTTKAATAPAPRKSGAAGATAKKSNPN
jgi:hypothetical protein